MDRRFVQALMVLFFVVLALQPLFAQGSNGEEFTFVRIVYNAGGVNYTMRNFQRRNFQFWAVDYPTAEENFIDGLRSRTSLKVTKDPVSLTLLDSEFYRYPFAYMVEVGYMSLSQAEADTLAEWLLRGGFLMVDDFHGPHEWQSFVRQMKLVFPTRTIVDIPISHPIFHCFYDFDRLIQIPGLGSWIRGMTYEKGGRQARYMGIFDEQDRLMVLVIRNMDMGDAWEHTYDGRYPGYGQEYAVEAYKLGINFVIYALTH